MSSIYLSCQIPAGDTILASNCGSLRFLCRLANAFGVSSCEISAAAIDFGLICREKN